MNKKNGLTLHDIGKTRRLLLSFPFRMLRREWLRLIQLFCFNLFSLISLFQEELIFPCSPWLDICTHWAEWCVFSSLRASSPIWASETSLARTRERAAKPRGPSLARSREARFACSQAMFLEENCWQRRGAFPVSEGEHVQCPGGHPWNWLNH